MHGARGARPELARGARGTAARIPFIDLPVAVVVDAVARLQARLEILQANN